MKSNQNHNKDNISCHFFYCFNDNRKQKHCIAVMCIKKWHILCKISFADRKWWAQLRTKQPACMRIRFGHEWKKNRPLKGIVGAGAGYWDKLEASQSWSRLTIYTAVLTCLRDTPTPQDAAINRLNSHNTRQYNNTRTTATNITTTVSSSSLKIQVFFNFQTWQFKWPSLHFRLVHHGPAYAGFPLLLCSDWNWADLLPTVSHLDFVLVGENPCYQTTRTSCQSPCQSLWRIWIAATETQPSLAKVMLSRCFFGTWDNQWTLRGLVFPEKFNTLFQREAALVESSLQISDFRWIAFILRIEEDKVKWLLVQVLICWYMCASPCTTEMSTLQWLSPHLY